MNFNGLFTLAYTLEELPEPEFWSRFIYLYKIDVHTVATLLISAVLLVQLFHLVMAVFLT
jgi:hypothetical protein